jgi:hypothetical protein
MIFYDDSVFFPVTWMEVFVSVVFFEFVFLLTLVVVFLTVVFLIYSNRIIFVL